MGLAALLGACSSGSSDGSGNAPATAPSPPQPLLMVSGEGDYWRTGQLASSETDADAQTRITVDPEQTFQTWYGFGGTFNEAGWQALSQLDARDRTQVLSLLFDKTDGIGFEWGRIPIGASDYALSRYSLASEPGDTALAQFSIEHDRQLLIPYIKAAQQIRPDLKLWGSPWSPPPWMKTNNAFDGGAFDPQYFEPYAQYFVRWIEAYQNEGIPIDHVQPQNEPGWAQAYPSCAWGPSIADGEFTDRPVTLGTFVEQHLAPALARSGLDTDLWYGTLSNNQTFEAYWNAVSPAGRALLTGVGLQWGTSGRAAELAQIKGKNGEPLRVMQTEHMCGNYPWLEARATGPADADRRNFLPDRAPNNHAYAEESWELIKKWLEAGVNIYSAWNLVLDQGGFNMDTTRPWPQNALIAVDTQAKRYSVTPAYYVFRHLGQYLQPGAKRVAVEGGSALAFQNPDGTVVTTLFNDQATPTQITLAVRDATAQFEVPARGWATVRW